MVLLYPFQNIKHEMRSECEDKGMHSGVPLLMPHVETDKVKSKNNQTPTVTTVDEMTQSPESSTKEEIIVEKRLLRLPETKKDDSGYDTEMRQSAEMPLPDVTVEVHSQDAEKLDQKFASYLGEEVSLRNTDTTRGKEKKTESIRPKVEPKPQEKQKASVAAQNNKGEATTTGEHNMFSFLICIGLGSNTAIEKAIYPNLCSGPGR